MMCCTFFFEILLHIYVIVFINDLFFTSPASCDNKDKNNKQKKRHPFFLSYIYSLIHIKKDNNDNKNNNKNMNKNNNYNNDNKNCNDDY